MYLWRPLLICLLLHATAIAGEVSTAHAAFSIEDESTVIAQPTPERFTLRSAKRGIEINVLVQSAPRITEKNIETATAQLLTEALHNHERAAGQWKLTLADVETKLSKVEQAWAGELVGRDSSGRRFHQLVLVRPGRIVAVYADTKTQPQEALLNAVTEVVRGMKE